MKKTLLISLVIMVLAVGLILIGYTEPASSQGTDLQQIVARVNALEKLNTDQQKELQTQQKELQTLRDIEEIKILQACYGFYFEKNTPDALYALFAEGPDTALHTLGGISEGLLGGSRTGLNDKNKKSEGKPNLMKEWIPEGSRKGTIELLHSLVFGTGVITVAPDGKTAKGRFYAIGAVATHRGKGINNSYSLYLYENDYVKENGVWKFKIVRCNMIYSYANPECKNCGFVNPERYWQNVEGPNFEAEIPEDRRDQSAGKSFRMFTEYPSGYIVPFHFKHPVTGKATLEEEQNKELGVPSPPGLYDPPK